MRKNVEKAMDALFAGTDARPSASVYTNQHGEYIATENGEVRGERSTYQMLRDGDIREVPCVYSYGDHYPMCLLDGDRAYVNAQSNSATTNMQRYSCREYLRLVAGYFPTGEVATPLDRGSFPFDVYQKAR